MKKNILNLFIFVCICTVITLLLAITNSITAPIILENQNVAANQALLEVMPEGKGFESVPMEEYTLPSTVTEVYKETNGLGYVIKLKTAGYGTDMVIMCGVDANGVVTGAVCLSSNETLGKEKTYGESFLNKDAAGVDATDTVNGATMTTGAYKSAIKDAINTATILGGGRTPEQIFAENMEAALPEADEFIIKPLADENGAISFIYAAKNGAGYVYVNGDVFVGMDAEGNVVSEGISADDATAAQSIGTLAAGHVTIDTTDSGINSNITSVQKNSNGNYVIEINGLGFAYFGDEEHYQPAKNIPIEICVVISSDGTILDCLTVSQKETGGYGAVCGEESYYSQFDGKTADTYKEVDAISGATITTNGYMKAIERCFDAVAILEGGAK